MCLNVHDIDIKKQSTEKKEKPDYLIRLNKSHDANVQFATLAHELAHLFLGHLGFDKFLNIPDRRRLSHMIKELEAESVCYIVCHKNEVKPNSEAYLSSFVNDNLEVEIWMFMQAPLGVCWFITKAERQQSAKSSQSRVECYSYLGSCN